MMVDRYDIPAYCQSAINHEQKSASVIRNYDELIMIFNQLS